MHKNIEIIVLLVENEICPDECFQLCSLSETSGILVHISDNPNTVSDLCSYEFSFFITWFPPIQNLNWRKTLFQAVYRVDKRGKQANMSKPAFVCMKRESQVQPLQSRVCYSRVHSGTFCLLSSTCLSKKLCKNMDFHFLVLQPFHFQIYVKETRINFWHTNIQLPHTVAVYLILMRSLQL